MGTWAGGAVRESDGQGRDAGEARNKILREGREVSGRGPPRGHSRFPPEKEWLGEGILRQPQYAMSPSPPPPACHSCPQLSP